MIQNYEQAEQFMLNREYKLGMNFGLERMRTALKKLGNPEKKFKSIHIAGSNGKGSTLTYLKEILMEEGYRVGSFTSPHLEKMNERIMINHEMISDEQFILLLNKLIPVMEEIEGENEENYLTYFEIVTILSFLYFEQKKPDIALIETGLGGRLDSTNVINPLIAIITSISMEHTNILGDTLAQIAFEKAGIIKEGITVVSGVHDEEPYKSIYDKAKEMNADLYTLGKEFRVTASEHEQDDERFALKWKDGGLTDLVIKMFGQHQIENASLAILSALFLNEKYSLSVSEKSIRTGLMNARWSGRFEKISDKPLTILDGAHNIAGVEALIHTIKSRYPGRQVHFLLAVLRDKDYKNMIAELDQVAASITFTEFTMDRCCEAEELYRNSKNQHKDMEKDWKNAVDKIQGKLDNKDIFIVAGSLYFLALVRPYLLHKK